jgi:phage shock protein B
MEDALQGMIAILIVGMLFIGLPWLIFHYVTRWKTGATLTSDDERMIEELYDLARRLDDRVVTVERIVTADNPNWRAIACDSVAGALEADDNMLRRIK